LPRRTFMTIAVGLLALAVVAAGAQYLRYRLNELGSQIATIGAEVTATNSLKAQLRDLPFETVTDEEIPRSADELLMSTSVEDLVSKRARLVERVLGGDYPSAGQIQVANVGADGRDLALTMNLEAAGTSVMRFFEAEHQPATCLFLYTSGHKTGLENLPPWASDVLQLARGLGCDVVHASMPAEGDNAGSVQVPNNISAHDWLGTLATADQSPLRWFVAPQLAALDWATTRRSYDLVVAAGHSGGGWTAGLLAAIDPRVALTIVYNGSSASLPRREVSDLGDWEQAAAPIYDEVTYGDLYLMSALGKGRRAVYLWSKYDTCCFSGVRPAVYFPLLQARAATWGITGLDFGIDLDRDTGHAIGPMALGTTAQFLLAGQGS